MSVPKWNEERTAALTELVGEVNGPVTVAAVADAAEALETSTRSISSKLRKMGYEVEQASKVAVKTFSDEEAAELVEFVEANDGDFTYKGIAEVFAGGKFTAKQVQGKILSLELTDKIKPTSKAESVRTYSEDEEVTFLDMAKKGAFLEEIAEELDRPVNSIRGKALSFLRTELLDSIPKQRDVKVAEKVDAFDSLKGIGEMTVEEIAEAIGKTARGVRTMLTRRGVTAANYDGAAKKAKAQKVADNA